MLYRKSMIQAVIFDLDDTLYDYKALDREAGRRVQDLVCRTLHTDEAEYLEAYRRGRRETKEQLGNTGASHNRLLYFQKTLEHLDCKPLSLSLQMYETYWGTFLTEMKLYPGARKLLDRLHERGILVGICTDLTAHIQHRKLEALGLTGDIDCLVTSEEAGQEKPAPEIFALCLKKLGVSPGDICFVGDDYNKDVAGALAAGMHAVWFCPNTDPMCGRDSTEYNVVTTYGQIEELLDVM